MTQYANKTEVPVAKSKMEIEMLVSKYGARGFASGWNGNLAMISFDMNARRIMFRIPLPDFNDREFTHDNKGYMRTPEKRNSVYEQAQRTRWRTLLLVIKAKLEAVETGVTTFEDEFMAHIALPNGNTVGEWMKPQIAHAYASNAMPPLMLEGPKQ
jgi:hypothetical protein